MMTVQVELSNELLQAARIQAHEAPKLLALELFREGAVSLGGRQNCAASRKRSFCASPMNAKCRCITSWKTWSKTAK